MVDRRNTELPGFFRLCLEERFVELHHIGTGRKQITDFVLEGRRAIHGERQLVVVEFIK